MPGVDLRIERFLVFGSVGALVPKKLVHELRELMMHYDTSALGICLNDMFIKVSDEVCCGRRFNNQIVVVEIHGAIPTGRGLIEMCFE